MLIFNSIVLTCLIVIYIYLSKLFAFDLSNDTSLNVENVKAINMAHLQRNVF